MSALALAERPSAVEAELIYLGEMDHPPTSYLGSDEEDDIVTHTVTMPIHDLRPVQDQVSFDREGFALFPAPTKVKDFRDPDQIKNIYIPELAEIAKAVTKADKVAMFKGGAFRFAPRAADFGATGTTYPSDRVHCDYNEKSGPRVARELLAPDEADYWMSKRMAVFSLWRALSPPPQDVPLCLCDARTLAPGDWVWGTVHFGKGEKRTSLESTPVLYRPYHRWCYFRDMHKDELLFIKAFDTDNTKSWRVPHTSFVDPSAPADAPPRTSMDIRCAVFWEE